MNRRACVPLMVVAFTGWTTHALAAPGAILVNRPPLRDGYSAISASVDVREVARAEGAPAPPDPSALRAELITGEERTPLACQFEPRAVVDGRPSSEGLVTVLLPPKTAPGPIELNWAGRNPLPADSPRVAVERRGAVLVVRNEHFAVTHDPAKQAGLPSRIEFLQSGKVFDSFALNDRVYTKELGGFRLREDAAPEVTVLAEGPVCVAVRVRARYLQGQKQPDTKPAATYEFRYYAGSPLVRVRARVAQQTSFDWRELHFLEINYPDESFASWATGEPLKEGKFEASEKALQAGKWGALVDGDNALGMMGCGALKLYDGRGGYGTYLHGPWVTWSSAEREFQAALWIGTTKEAPKAVQQTAATFAPERPAYVSVRPLLDALANARDRCSMVRGAEGARAAWVVDRIEQIAHGEGRLVEGLRLARAVAERLSGDQRDDVTEWFAAQTKNLLRRLDDGRLLAVFDSDSLRLFSLYDLRSRRELLAPAPPPLWELALEAKEQAETLTAEAADWTRRFEQAGDDATRAQLRWRRSPEPGPLEVVCDARLANGGLSLSLSVSNDSPRWSLSEITFPQVELRALGETPDDDTVVTARGSGELRKAPLLNPYSFGGRYPSGWSTMQFAAYYDPKGGLYFAAEDPLASTKDLQVETVSDRPALALRVRWPAPDTGVAGNDWRTPGQAALRLMGDHWFHAAEQYKAWASKHAKWWPAEGRPDTPDWFKDVALWALTGGAPKDCVDSVKKLAAYLGVPLAFHWYNWHQIPFDVEYPHYFPTKDGMPEGVKELQRAGVRVMPYINGRLWDTGLDDFKNEAVKYCTKDRKGEPYIEVYGSGAKLSPMCPFTPFWQHKVQEIVLRLTGPEVGVDAVYLDQIAAARPRLCFDRSHGHPLAGGHWWTTEGYWPLLTELRSQLKARTPNKVLTSECNAESYSHVLDGLLTWHFQYQDQIPLFAAVYGGRIQLFSRAYKGNDQVAHRMKAGQSFVFGEQLGWLNPGLVLDNKETGEFIRALARLRYQLRGFLARGEMAHPPLVQGRIADVTADWAWRDDWPITTSALQSSAWRAPDGRIAFFFVNVSDEPVTAAWVFRGDDYGFGPTAQFEVEERTRHRTATEPAVFLRPLNLAPRRATVFLVTGRR